MRENDDLIELLSVRIEKQKKRVGVSLRSCEFECVRSVKKKMPHRTTYFFPRQFPERGFDASANKQLLENHEKKIKETFNVESDRKTNSSSSTASTPTVSKKSTTAHNFRSSALSDLLTSSDEKFQLKKQHLAAFCDWFSEKRTERSTAHHVKSRLSSGDEDRELLLPPPAGESVPEPVVVHERSLDPQPSLPRLSSGSSYAGSLFSGTTIDGNLFSGTTVDGHFSSDVKDTSTLVSTSRQDVEEGEEPPKESLAQKMKDSYMLQMTLARRLTIQANLANEPPLLQDCGSQVTDPETVSYRLWVSFPFAFFEY